MWHDTHLALNESLFCSVFGGHSWCQVAPKNRFSEAAPLHKPKLRLACSFSVSNRDTFTCFILPLRVYRIATETWLALYIVQAVSPLPRMLFFKSRNILISQGITGDTIPFSFLWYIQTKSGQSVKVTRGLSFFT